MLMRCVEALGRRGVQLPAAFFFSQPSSQDEWSPASLHNAVRDGAQWAWVPHGDTCPFCITLASRGWQTASKKLLKNGHAEHIHSNCDCEFAVRFHSGTSVAGYDPEKYLRQYRDAGSDVNAMRRIDYAARKDAINAQKWAAYAARKVNKSERSYSGGVGSNKTDLDYIL